MAGNTMDQDISVKQEFIEIMPNMDYIVKDENNSNPWLIENAESFLKYCCTDCDFKSTYVQEFSKHVSMNHYTSHLFFQTEIKDPVKKKILKNNEEVGTCVVPNCNIKKSHKFFKFPKQQQKYDYWLQLCGLKMIKEEDRICASHFAESDFYLELKRSAHPSLNLNLYESEVNLIVPIKGKVVVKMYLTRFCQNLNMNSV